MIDSLLIRSGLSSPDKRPLFAYRLTDDDFERLGARLPEAERCKSPEFEQLFCLYVAEWYRRCFSGGSFSWDVALAHVGLQTANVPNRMRWTLHGLRAWRRSVRTGSDGSSMYLFSLIAEGGFPLRLLQSENANRFKRYFHSLLEIVAGWSATDVARCVADPSALLDLGRRPASMLPVSLTSADLLRLCAELMTTLWSERIDAGQRPPKMDWLEHLDRKRPGWRYRLPIEVEDENARRLLDGLLTAGETLGRVHSTAVRWSLRGETTDGAVLLRRSFRTPVNLLARQIEDAVGLEPTGRIRLSAVSAESGESKYLGDLTKSRTRQPDGWTFDSVVSDGQLPVTMSLCSLGLRCELPGLDRRDCWDVPGSSAPPDNAPWIFVRTGGELDTPSLELVATGSCRRSEDEVWVCVPPESLVVGEAIPLEWKTNGNWDRHWWLVAGPATVAVGSDVWTIRSGEQNADDGEYSIAGATVAGHLGNRPIYRGVPEIRAGTPTRAIPRGQCQFRASGESWLGVQDATWGTGHLRHVLGNADVRFVARALIAPQDLELRATWGSVPHPGHWTVRSSALEALHVVGANEPPNRDGSSWTVRAPTTEANEFAVTLIGKRGEQLHLQLPNPIARIQVTGSDGQAAQQDQLIHIARLEHWRVRWQGKDLPMIHAALWKVPPTGEAEPVSDRQWTLNGPEAPEAGLPCEIYLSALRSQIGDWLSSTDVLDAEIRISFQWIGAAHVPARLRIRRYDWTLVPKKGEFAFEFKGEGVPIVEAKLLRRAEDPAIELVVSEDGLWRLPVEYASAPGTWLVTARDGNWQRCRPTAKILPTQDAEELGTGETALAQSIEARDKDRPAAIQDALSALNGNFADPGWPLLEALAAMTRDLPAAAIDATRLLRHRPQIAATALFRLDDADVCRALQRSFVGMGFVWEAVPLSFWLQAARKYRAYLLAFLPDDLVATLLAERVRRVVDLVPTVALALQQCEQVFGISVDSLGLGSTLADESRSVGNVGVAPFLRIQRAELIDDLRRSRPPPARWPAVHLDGLVFAPSPIAHRSFRGLTQDVGQSNHPGFCMDVFSAPALVAVAARFGVLLDESVLFKIRTCRSFYEPFFDRDVKLCLALLPALTPAEVDTP